MKLPLQMRWVLIKPLTDSKKKMKIDDAKLRLRRGTKKPRLVARLLLNDRNTIKKWLIYTTKAVTPDELANFLVKLVDSTMLLLATPELRLLRSKLRKLHLRRVILRAISPEPVI